VRFEELIVQVPDEELRLRFHPQLTVLSGLGPAERAAMADTIIGSLAGGPEDTALRYLDATGEAVIVLGREGRIAARRDDGAPVAEPVGTLATSSQGLRELMLLTPDGLGPELARRREDEPPELAEARDTLEELTEQLEAARQARDATAEVRRELEQLDQDLTTAREGLARREYAQVLALLERVRAEAAALQSDHAGIEADRTLLGLADEVRELAASWAAATARVAALSEQAPGESLDEEQRQRFSSIPEAPPGDLPRLVHDLAGAAARRQQLDQRLQDLAVEQLPAPSDPLVADLGVLDQATLWATGDRVARAEQAMHQVKVSLGGLELDDLGPAPSVVEEIERAHAALEEAQQALAATRIAGVAGAALGITAGVLGVAVAPLLVPVGLGAAAVAAGAGIVRPNLRLARAAKAEQAALSRADATSYLGFHIRRVEASVDPNLRENVERATDELQAAQAAWVELVGPGVAVASAMDLRDEAEAYAAALRDLGESADEMEHLRTELADDAIPAWRDARAAVTECCRAYELDPEAIDDPALVALVEAQCRRGAAARAQELLHTAEVVAQRTAERLAGHLFDLGFDSGSLDARVGALEWAVTRAEEREDARRRARPQGEVDAELAELTERAARLRRPEWDSVTAAEAEAPDIASLEARREQLVTALGTAPPQADVERLTDRHAALERRVAALEARLGSGANGDPGALADLQQALLAHLTAAAQAGPSGDPVPVVLDEPFLRVPADRTWDLLDLLLRLAERHQLIYLTDDAFVAAWARQRALDGSITLLAPAPDGETEPV